MKGTAPVYLPRPLVPAIGIVYPAPQKATQHLPLKNKIVWGFLMLLCLCALFFPRSRAPAIAQPVCWPDLARYQWTGFYKASERGRLPARIVERRKYGSGDSQGENERAPDRAAG